MRLEWTTWKFRREKPGQMVAITSQEVPSNCDNSDRRQRCCGSLGVGGIPVIVTIHGFDHEPVSRYL